MTKTKATSDTRGTAHPATPALSEDRAVQALAAIAHNGRLRLLRALIQAGDHGIAAGQLAETAGINLTTASAQLLVLRNAGLVSKRRDGRQIIYRAHYRNLQALLSYLMFDCCAGQAAICDPLSQALRVQTGEVLGVPA
ncbi:MAG: metalloregulator ArsR/SmtB family transcription factor [Pseudomonadota bacterium]